MWHFIGLCELCNHLKYECVIVCVMLIVRNSWKEWAYDLLFWPFFSETILIGLIYTYF